MGFWGIWCGICSMFSRLRTFHLWNATSIYFWNSHILFRSDPDTDLWFWKTMLHLYVMLMACRNWSGILFPNLFLSCSQTLLFPIILFSRISSTILLAQDRLIINISLLSLETTHLCRLFVNISGKPDVCELFKYFFMQLRKDVCQLNFSVCPQDGFQSPDVLDINCTSLTNASEIFTKVLK